MSRQDNGAALSLDQWRQFLDVKSDDDALYELRRLGGRLCAVYNEFDHVCRRANFSPDGSIEEDLRVARIGLTEGIRGIADVARRFDHSEPQNDD